MVGHSALVCPSVPDLEVVSVVLNTGLRRKKGI